MRPKTILRSRTALLFLLAAALAPRPAAAADHSGPLVAPASSFPAVDIHDQEKVTIAAEPYESREKAYFFRVDYLKYGFMPIRLIVTNDGDRPISLKDARIHFITAAGDRIPAAEPEDIERAATRDSHAGKTIPLPAPLPPLRGKIKSMTKEIEADFASFEYGALAVEPHTTRAGFLFYDVRGLANPLRGAKLYLRQLHDASGNDLFYFEIPFDKYLAAKPPSP